MLIAPSACISYVKSKVFHASTGMISKRRKIDKSTDKGGYQCREGHERRREVEVAPSAFVKHARIRLVARWLDRLSWPAIGYPNEGMMSASIADVSTWHMVVKPERQ
jgi:hypothetical protein